MSTPSDPPSTPKKVFISYSHDSPEHSERVLQLAWALRDNSVDVELDQFHNEEIVDWPRWCNEQTSRATSAFVLCICTAEYKRRIEGYVPPEKGKGVYWEGSLLDDDLYDAKGNSRLLPVLFDDEPESNIPRFLNGWTRCRVRDFVRSEPGFEHLLRILLRRSAVEKNPLGSAPDLGTKRAPLSPNKSAPALKADVTRIVEYTANELIGREVETRMLTAAWDKVLTNETIRPHILTFVALGGEGKTSLVANWAVELERAGWPGCDSVFAWSFYSQGTREEVATSSDFFLSEALKFFGDPEMAASAQSAFEKGRRLAHLIGEKKALLILDGVEPLQYAPGPPMNGRLKDDGLSELLKRLASRNDGLCLVTTRYSIADLHAYWKTTAPEIKLTRLSTEAGVRLLQTLGVEGSMTAFKKLVEDVKGHALTLNLLGTYLRDAHNGDIRKRDLVKFEEADAEEQGGHAFRVMEAYERSLLGEGDRGERAVAFLRLLGLFDRPASVECLEALQKEPAIDGLTAKIIGLGEAQRNVALQRLTAASLISIDRDGDNRLVSLDTHPLIREYFSKRLRKEEEAFRAGHKRLYEHLVIRTMEGEHPTLEDLQPLYQAVAHGCQAGIQQRACDDVYFARIVRGRENYSAFKLGAYGSDLGAEACFFEQPWSRVSAALTEADQGWLLNETAFRLRALGRLTESLEPMRVSGEIDVNAQRWSGAAASYSNLSELELTLGNVAAAIRDADKAVNYADRSGEAIHRLGKRTIYADALQQAGRRQEANTHFLEAEQMQEERQPEYPLLYSVQGFKYCDLLLAASECAAWRMILSLNSQPLTIDTSISDCGAVFKRGTKMFEWRLPSDPLLDIGLDHLTLSRAALYASILGNSESVMAKSEAEQAVTGLRRAGQVQELPRGLLNRAWLRFFVGVRIGPERAQEDLDEAWEIAERSSMRLFMADIHLYRARLFYKEEEYPWNKHLDGTPRGYKDDLAAAEKLINECGYHRRDEELADAKKAILGV